MNMFYPSTASVWKIRDLINKKLYHTRGFGKKRFELAGASIPDVRYLPEKDPRAALAGELPIFSNIRLIRDGREENNGRTGKTLDGFLQKY